MSHIGSEVEIIQMGHMLSMKVKGDFATWEKLITIGDDKAGQSAEGEDGETRSTENQNVPVEGGGDDRSIFQGRFKIRPLVTFTKCSQLSTRFEILLKNKFAIILT